MVATAAGTALSQAHDLAQAKVEANALRATTIAFRRLLDPANPFEGFPLYSRATASLLNKYRADAAGVANAYYTALRTVEGVTAPMPPLALPAPLAVAQVQTSLLVTGPVAATRQTSRGVLAEVAMEAALRMTQGSVGRHVQNGGRDALRAAVKADPASAGWARRSGGTPCAFCAMLIGRGPVYKEDTASFRCHDGCHCKATPFFDEANGWTAQATEFNDLWESSTRGKSGADARRAYTSAHAAKYGKPTSPAVTRMIAEDNVALVTRGRNADFKRWAVNRDLAIPKRPTRRQVSALQESVDIETRYLDSTKKLRLDDVSTSKARLLAEEDRLKSYVGSGSDYRKARKKDTGIARAESELKTAEQRLAAFYDDPDFTRQRAALDADVARLDGLKETLRKPLPEFTADNPLAGYGDRLNIADTNPVTEAHLRELETYFPLGTHRTIRDHYAGSDSGGFYVGDGAVPQLDDLGDLSGTSPRGWSDEATWDQVPGAYNPAKRVCACGGGGQGHGSTSLALHEGSHALDHALETSGITGLPASGTPAFQGVFDQLEGFGVSPYYSRTGNPTGHYSEAFAEGHAAFSKLVGDGLKGDDLTLRVMESLGVRKSYLNPAHPAHADAVEAARSFVGYFEDLRRSME